jgi:hypothetical protein
MTLEAFMKLTGLHLVLVLPLIFFSLISVAAVSQKSPAAASKKNIEPDGYVLVQEDFALDMQGLPLLYMNDAQREFINNNYGESAADLEVAARLVGIEAKEVQSSDAQGELMTEEGLLSRLRQDLTSGNIKSYREFAARLADSFHHQAANHRLRASEAWGVQQYKRAGHELDFAANAIEDAARWTGRDLDKTTITSLAEIRKLSSELRQGAGWTAVDVKRELASLDSDISRFGKDLGLPRESVTSSAKRDTRENGSESGTTRSAKP